MERDGNETAERVPPLVCGERRREGGRGMVAHPVFYALSHDSLVVKHTSPAGNYDPHTNWHVSCLTDRF